jgi:rhamnosyltransferase
MIPNNVTAIVVTFHPDSDVLENLSKLRKQVHSVVVVDNGSRPESLVPFRAASLSLGFRLIENGENLGVATALNIGIRHAQIAGADWVLLFDQDSIVTPGFTEAMLQGFASSRWKDRLGILVPHYIDKRLGSPLSVIGVKGGELEGAITSGSLLPMSVVRDNGCFEDCLFIDAVDFEYSLRLRSRGLHIEECSQAVLLHSPGTPKLHRFRGRYLFQSNNYSPTRRYYQQRNNIWIARRYWTIFPRFCFNLFFASLKDSVKILIAEDDKWTKLQAGFIGIVDGIRERMGRKEMP